MKKTYAGLAMSVLVLLSACTVKHARTPACIDEVVAVVTPKVVHLRPGETVQPSFEVRNCRGHVKLQVAPRWVSANRNVATVNRRSGLITAQARGGKTRVTVSERTYGTKAVVRVNVAVVDPRR